MCGILGGSEKNWEYESGLKSMAYRGPDGLRIQALPGFHLGFVRLSIRDLSTRAMQPMLCEDENAAIVFNGEIYGCDALKKRLEGKGYAFRTTSDTEVILNAYLEYGEAFVNDIDGMFAIAIYDKIKQMVHVYRDRLGIKPVYYYYSDGKFAFSSELKGLLKTCTTEKFQIDYTAIYDYLTYRYIPEPKSMYKNIYKLEPAYKISYSIAAGKAEKQKYWKLHVNTKHGKQRKAEDLEYEVKRLISKSVSEQLVADVPVGTFLSGGIDSSIVSAEIYQLNREIQTFSMGFDVKKKEKEYDETAYAQKLADKFQIPLHTQKFNKASLDSLKKQIVDWYDEPFADTSCFPTYLIAKYAKESGMTVVLTGDGGDEVFGGYLKYPRWSERIEKKHLNAQGLSRLYFKLLHQYASNEGIENELLDEISLFAKESYCTDYSIKKEFAKRWNIGLDYDDNWYFKKFDHPELPAYTRAQYIDLKTYLPADILTKVDRAAMQNSLETRVPFLSKELVEFSFSLSQEDRCPKGELKGLLKNAYQGILPDEILYKNKKGFSFPHSYWKNGLNERVFMLDKFWNIRREKA